MIKMYQECRKKQNNLQLNQTVCPDKQLRFMRQHRDTPTTKLTVCDGSHGPVEIVDNYPSITWWIVLSSSFFVNVL
jgi:hypothetical protein